MSKLRIFLLWKFYFSLWHIETAKLLGIIPAMLLSLSIAYLATNHGVEITLLNSLYFVLNLFLITLIIAPICGFIVPLMDYLEFRAWRWSITKLRMQTSDNHQIAKQLMPHRLMARFFLWTKSKILK